MNGPLSVFGKLVEIVSLRCYLMLDGTTNASHVKNLVYFLLICTIEFFQVFLSKA